MSDDATLDTFAREDDEHDESGEAGADEPDATPVTSSWSDGTTCESCGEPAERRWLDDGERVCATCKRWA